MQSRILTRFTIIPVFLFTCFLTMDVVAKERDLAPILSADAWQLIAEAAAYQQGFIPSQPKQLQLTPRKVKVKRPLVKEPYSRVLVKFANDLQVRLDVHSRPTTKSGHSVQTIRDLLDSMNVSLQRSSHNSVATVEALLAKAERLSRREQPDLEGIYWLEGEESSVDAVAEMLWTMNEVEYIYYKPVYELQPKRAETPRPVKKDDRAQRARSEDNILQSDSILTGACHISSSFCEAAVTQRVCIDRGGTFLGVNSICPSDNIKTKKDNNTSETVLPDLGECCLLSGCVKVLAEVFCTNVNGIYLGPVALGAIACAAQTDCPTGIGPDFTEYDDCAAFGDYISYFAGDCYIDQTVQPYQPERVAFNGPIPTGCCDTNGATNANGDFIVITGAPTNAGTNVYELSSCCLDISTDVPYCDTNPWDTVCSDYANSDPYSSPTGAGVPCFRPGGASILTWGCAPFGPMQLPSGVNAVQPLINLQNVGSALNITNTGIGGTTSARFRIMYFDASTANKPVIYTVPAKYLLGYINGSWTGTPPIADLEILLNPDVPTGETLEQLASNISAGGFATGWNATASGDTNTTLSAEVGTYPLTNALNMIQTVFATQIASGCATPDGWPSSPRSNTTPDFAAMGLMAWMSAETIPWQFGSIAAQPNPLPIFPPWQIEVVADELRYHQLNQLLSWPMGGALGPTAASNYPPPMASVENIPPDQIANLGRNYLGVDLGFQGNGINLFPQLEIPGSFGGGTSQRYSGAYGLGDFWVAENGGVNGAYGNNVKVAVIDWSAHVEPGNMHEDLEHVILEGEETGHDPLTLIFDETIIDFTRSADHGTAVLGVIGASWGPNSAPGVSAANRLAGNVGALGMAPDADLFFFPLKSQEHGGRTRDAWENAISVLEPGDIICAAYRKLGVTPGEPNLNFDSIVNDLMEVATSLGICVVIRAGDGANLQAVNLLDMVFEDQNAVVATAVSPGEPYKRWANGLETSNYMGAGQAIEDAAVSGWGTGVVTCGKGPQRDNFLGYSTTLYDDPTDVDEVNRRAYTNGFDNTGAAAAQAAGSLAILQGFSKQFHSINLGPSIARLLLSGGEYGGTDKDGVENYVYIASDTQNASSSSCELGPTPTLTWDHCPEPPWTGNRTGMFLDPRRSMQNVTTNPVFETPNIDEVIVIRGDHIEGLPVALSVVDNNYFAVNPEQTEAYVNYAVPSSVPGGTVSYRGSGRTTDIYISGKFESLISGTIDIDVTHLPSQASRLYSQFYMWDFALGMWRQAAASSFLPMGSVTPGEVTVQWATRYLDPVTYRYHLRVITQDNSNNHTGGPTNPWPIYYDRILITPGGLTIPVP